MPERIIDELWFSVARVVSIIKGIDRETATGFFYRANDRQFLVTNRHVVVDGSKNCFPDALRFFVHIDPSDPKKNQELSTPLYGENGQRCWLEHPRYKSSVDIIALSLERILPSGSVVHFITSQDLFPDDVIMRFSEDVAVLGYPLGYYDEINNFPVLRNGTVSTPYPIGFRGKPCFLVDAKLHKGSSGSPVFTKSQPGFERRNGSAAFGPGMGKRFLGIVSMDVSPERADQKLDLYYVWFGQLVEEIASQETST